MMLATSSVLDGHSRSLHLSRCKFHFSSPRKSPRSQGRYLIGQCIGGIVFPPYSEAFGRKKLYIMSTALYSIFCVVVGIVPSLAGVMVGRFFSGFLSAIPTVIVAGSMEDMFNSKARIWMIFLWAMAANFGLSMGPVMSSYITERLSW